MKKIIPFILISLMASSLYAQTLQKPSTLPLPTNPGKAPLVSPNVKFRELPDLTVSCSGTTFTGAVTYNNLNAGSGSQEEAPYSIGAIVIVHITNHGPLASRPGALRGFLMSSNPSTSSRPTPLIANLKNESMRNAAGWALCSSEECDNSVGAIEPGATADIECGFTLSGAFRKTGGLWIIAFPEVMFYTAAIDYDNTTVESNEGNNVSGPIRLTKTE